MAAARAMAVREPRPEGQRVPGGQVQALTGVLQVTAYV